MKFGFLLVILLGLGIAMFATKPQPAAFEAHLQALFADGIDDLSPNVEKDPLGALIVSTCRVASGGCYQLIRALVDVDYADLVLVSRYDITADDRTTTCWGALTQVMCPDL